MELAISMGPGGELLDILNSGFREADSLGIAVAYMTDGGFGGIKPNTVALSAIWDDFRCPVMDLA